MAYCGTQHILKQLHLIFTAMVIGIVQYLRGYVSTVMRCAVKKLPNATAQGRQQRAVYGLTPRR